MATALSNEHIQKKVNSRGKSLPDKRERFEYVKHMRVKSRLKILIKCIYTGEKKVLALGDILRGSPFSVRSNLHPMIIEEIVNEKGRESKDKREHFCYVKNKMVTKNRAVAYRSVLIRSLYSGETRWVDYTELKSKGSNPFRLSNRLQDSVVEHTVNNCGKKEPKHLKYRFIKTYTVQQEGKHKSRKVVVENLFTKEKKDVFYQSIVNGHNPFNVDKEFNEVEVIHPKIHRSLKKMGFKEVVHESDTRSRLSFRSKPDFVCETKSGKYVVIEVKSDDQKWTPKHLKTQTSKYAQDAKKKFGKKFAGVFLVSLKGGIHGGYSVKDLPKVLKSQRIIG